MKAKAFLKYFEKTYLGYMKTGLWRNLQFFAVKMWNHYDNDDFSSLSFSNLDLYSFKPKTKYVEDLLDTNCF